MVVSFISPHTADPSIPVADCSRGGKDFITALLRLQSRAAVSSGEKPGVAADTNREPSMRWVWSLSHPRLQQPQRSPSSIRSFYAIDFRHVISFLPCFYCTPNFIQHSLQKAVWSSNGLLDPLIGLSCLPRVLFACVFVLRLIAVVFTYICVIYMLIPLLSLEMMRVKMEVYHI